MNGDTVTEMENTLRTQRDNLSAERTILIATLSRAFPSVMSYHAADDTGMDGGRAYDGWVVYVQLPTGQVSFHTGDDTRHGWFSHVVVANMNPWDGHSTEEKWDRVSKYIDSKDE